MMLQIPSVLNQEQLSEVKAQLAQVRFVDGKLSAGKGAVRVKHNEEIELGVEGMEILNKIVVGNLHANEVFRHVALPHRVSSAVFARYTSGMAYGDHIDDPVMGEGARYRSDISTTLFLSEPQDYDGGELVVRTTYGEREVKLPAGDAIIYPSSSLHHINEVTRGERLVAVIWTQSLVRDADRRQLLYDLHVLRESLRNVYPEAEVTAKADNVYANLIRMWADV